MQQEPVLSPYQSDSSSRDDLNALLPSSSTNFSKIRATVESYQNKIAKIKAAIRVEQNARDENVNEYLKLVANADKAQTQRIKSLFEKRNKESAHAISLLQKKLELHYKKIRDLETNGMQAMHQPSISKAVFNTVGQGLKGVGTNIKEGISGLSEGVIGGIKTGLSAAAHATVGDTSFSKSKKAGSAEHIATSGDGSFADTSGNLTGNETEATTTETPSGKLGHHNHGASVFYTFSQTHSHSTKHTSEDESSSLNSGSGQVANNSANQAGTSGFTGASPAKQMFKPFGDIRAESGSGLNSGSLAVGSIDLESILSSLRDRENDYQRLAEEIEALKTQFQAEYSLLSNNLQEERYKSERLEEQLNDLTELHQNEIENLKQNIRDMEEKVQYQSDERLRDISEMLESYQTRISRMEHQQHQHLQQLVNLDSFENSNAKALMLKIVNILLIILQLLLFLVSAIANITAPFLKTKTRALITLILCMFLVAFFQQKYEFTIWLHNVLAKFFPIILNAFQEELPEKG